MDKHLLAQQLRQRQYTRSHLSRQLIDAVSDEEMIDCYITCFCCGEKQVTPQQLEAAIAQARDAYHFLMICDEQARAASRGTYGLLHLTSRDLLVANASESDVGIAPGHSSKEVALFGGRPGCLSRMILKVVRCAISDSRIASQNLHLPPVRTFPLAKGGGRLSHVPVSRKSSKPWFDLPPI
ncbi:MAG TPA: hypothetical protein VIY29_28285 [Ktedonobacteraceae bacterium]